MTMGLKNEDLAEEFYSRIPDLEKGDIALKRLTDADLDGLTRLVSQKEIYRYEPTFLFELQYSPGEVIRRLYTECISSSLILGIYAGGEFSGLFEFYGFLDEIHKVSVGYRLLKEFWGRGIATEALKLAVDYLYSGTGIEIITASTRPENHASEKVLTKCGFTLAVRNSKEDWGFTDELDTNKWIR